MKNTENPKECKKCQEAKNKIILPSVILGFLVIGFAIYGIYKFVQGIIESFVS
jgi:hypothetical protein